MIVSADLGRPLAYAFVSVEQSFELKSILHLACTDVHHRLLGDVRAPGCTVADQMEPGVTSAKLKLRNCPNLPSIPLAR